MKPQQIWPGRAYRRGSVVRKVDRIYEDDQGHIRAAYSRVFGRGARLHDAPILETFARWAEKQEPETYNPAQAAAAQEGEAK